MPRWRGCVFAAVAAIIVASGAWSAEKDPAPAVDPLADRILKAACDYLKTSPQFSFLSEATHEELLDSGQKIQVSESHQVGVRRPDGLVVVTRGDLGTQRVWYNGKRFTLLDLDEFTYASIKVPPTIDRAFDYLAEHYGVFPPLVDLLYSDPYGVVRPSLRSGELIGRRWVRGVECIQLAFQGDVADLQVWVENGLRPVIRKVVIDYKNEPGRPEYVAYLSEWDFSPRLTDSQFTFSPPPGAREVTLPVIEDGGKRGDK